MGAIQAPTAAVGMNSNMLVPWYYLVSQLIDNEHGEWIETREQIGKKRQASHSL